MASDLLQTPGLTFQGLTPMIQNTVIHARACRRWACRRGALTNRTRAPN